jgi:transposase-like protein
MTKKKVNKTPVRTYHSAEFKYQAVLRSAKEGVPSVTRDLDLAPAQLYA